MTDDELEGWRRSLSDLYAQAQVALEQQGELVDRSNTLIQMAKVHERRHASLMREARDIERLLAPPKGPIAKIRAQLDKWKKEREANDGYPGI